MLSLLKILLIFGLVGAGSMHDWLVQAVLTAVFINAGLFAFNIMPIPPLDGSHLLLQGMAIKEETAAIIYKYGIYLLLGIILLESQLRITILPVRAAVEFITMNGFKLFGLIP